MTVGTAIEWTEVTWNPTTGCDRVTSGCDNCYALTLSKRLKAMGAAKYPARQAPDSVWQFMSRHLMTRTDGVVRASCSSTR
jgi:protein gp37